MSSIKFFSEDSPYQLKSSRKTIQWIKHVIKEERFKLNHINFIFCSDEYLHQINVEYLNHNTLTDIITFDSAETKGHLEGDIFISVPRIEENAIKFKISFDQEMHRVIIHGILHLMGYSDKSRADKIVMRGKEDAYLSLLMFKD